jgi:hypothetical protein
MAAAKKQKPAGVPRAVLRFPNEELLRWFIYGLLVRMPGTESVQITHGRDEVGKDIVFRIPQLMGEPRNCACVVKNKPFSGRVGHSLSTVSLVQQARQALASTFVDPSGQRQPIHQVYIINPHQVTQTALAAMEGELAPLRRQITFCTGAELYRLFEKHWPDVLNEEFSVVARFAHELAEASGSRRSLRQLALDYGLGTVPKAAEHPYIPPSLEREVLVYSLPKRNGVILPSSRISGLWHPGDVERLYQSWHRLLQFLTHLSSWPFPELHQDPDLGTITATHDELLERVRSGLLSAFHRRSRMRITHLGQISRNAKPFDLPAAERSVLKPLAARAAEQVGAWFGQARCFLTRALPTPSDDAMDADALLASPDFLAYCAADDCLREAPSQILEVVGSRLFRWGRGLHRRHQGSLLIVGAAGTGKTCFCARHALEDARDLATGAEGHRRPLYVPLQRVAQTEGATFRDVFLRTAGHSALLPAEYSDPDHGLLRVYLDGLDEVGDAAARARLLRLAHEGVAEERDCQLIITARDYLYDPLLEWLPRLTLSGLTREEFRELAGEWLAGDAAAVDDLAGQLDRLPSIRALVRIPLLATVYVVSKSETPRKLHFGLM